MGDGRKTVVAVVKNQRFVLSRRSSSARARLEAEALRRLEATGLVPNLIAVEDPWVVQEHVVGISVKEALHRAADQFGKGSTFALMPKLVDIQNAMESMPLAVSTVSHEEWFCLAQHTYGY